MLGMTAGGNMQLGAGDAITVLLNVREGWWAVHCSMEYESGYGCTGTQQQVSGSQGCGVPEGC
jgi:hypothetical protein